ncbi:threonine dehydratase [Actinomadura sp. NBRC 104412]|uniref:threonine/serine dehydratase n=1 Tax=Actinomadura sp. NBRC 104412 TaxID=3032203 RepID=UPI0024A5D93A|nr:threonine/serine dehydratase [Actinomadura sp. NBRC 104412]GLZ06011.1 threonine dehydratase [Actinomadura sp. NBRC 104412]
MIDVSDVRDAARRIAGHVRRTPVMRLDLAAFVPRNLAGTMWWKLEHTQHTGSFKARGAFNRILAALEADELPEAGIVAASGGNAGLAFAYAASQVGAKAEVYVPETAPAVKVARLRALGATVVQVGVKYADAYEAAIKRQKDTGALFCHPYDQPEMCAGAGTIALELMEQTKGEIDTVLVAVGGGGLIAGVATALDGRADVVSVEPHTAPTLNAALQAGKPVHVEVSGVAADALGASRLGEIPYAAVTRAGVRSVLVTDEAISATRRRLWEEYRLVVEPSGAAAAAALASGAYRPAEGERVAVLLCGANTSPDDLA